MSHISAVVYDHQTDFVVNIKLPFGWKLECVYLRRLPGFLYFLADQGFIRTIAFRHDNFGNLDWSEATSKAGGETAETEEIGKYA